MSEKQEFISLALRPDSNIARLCRYFQISRKTAYKWLTRFRREGEGGRGHRFRLRLLRKGVLRGGPRGRRTPRFPSNSSPPEAAKLRLTP
ncbi:MAG: helix-turn-helix domain-containing protein [Desulfobaccales bacterium]